VQRSKFVLLLISDSHISLFHIIWYQSTVRVGFASSKYLLEILPLSYI